MERITLADDLSFSRIVYGMWRLGDDADTSPAHVQAKIESCLEQGITTMDQADIYGGYEAEEILGNAFKVAPHLKDKVEIVQMQHRGAGRPPRGGTGKILRHQCGVHHAVCRGQPAVDADRAHRHAADAPAGPDDGP